MLFNFQVLKVIFLCLVVIFNLQVLKVIFDV